MLMLGAMAVSGAALANDAAGELPDPVGDWDILWFKVLADIVIIGVIFGVVALYWLVKYRAKSPDDVGRLPKLSRAQAISWALIPAAVFMADDFFLAAKGWTVWNTFRRVPADAVEIKVIGYQWYWEFEYENGVVSDELHVPIGKPVVLRMTSEDVIHSFYMPDYRVKEDVMPGRTTYVWFLPRSTEEVVALRDIKTTPNIEDMSDEEKMVNIVCTEYCGISHSEMNGEVLAESFEEFQKWLEEEKASAMLESQTNNS
ncbi:cytochrome c oxidase aa3, subunit II [Magnetospira sp. QH-2]|nr:cytochrome c oxidase aa3, subunit II [Magnetospira sp. QH-2]